MDSKYELLYKSMNGSKTFPTTVDMDTKVIR